LVLDIDDYPFITSSSAEKIFLKRIVAKSLPRKAVKVIVASKGLLEYYRKEEGLRNVIYIPNSADLSIFNPANYGKQVSDSEPTFVWSGILYFHTPWKFIVKAFKNMKNGARLLIIGDGPARGSLSKLLKSLKIQRKVEITGWLPHTEVPRVLASADIGLLPQYDDMYHRCKCPIKLFEYMAMKLPIVSTNVGEPAYMIHKTGCGVSTSVNYKEFANAMDEIVENLEYWKERGRLGRKYLERCQNWDLLSTKLEETLMNAITLTLTN
jgi:glycosyltransferase involved in cell wall biosynthesis